MMTVKEFLHKGYISIDKYTVLFESESYDYNCFEGHVVEEKYNDCIIDEFSIDTYFDEDNIVRIHLTLDVHRKETITVRELKEALNQFDDNALVHIHNGEALKWNVIDLDDIYKDTDDSIVIDIGV